MPAVPTGGPRSGYGEMVRGRVKGVLRHLGLLSTARRVQGEIDTLRSLPSNVPWLYRGPRDGFCPYHRHT